MRRKEKRQDRMAGRGSEGEEGRRREGGREEQYFSCFIRVSEDGGLNLGGVDPCQRSVSEERGILVLSSTLLHLV